VKRNSGTNAIRAVQGKTLPNHDKAVGIQTDGGVLHCVNDDFMISADRIGGLADNRPSHAQWGQRLDAPPWDQTKPSAT
jgi:hypothetical protein